MNALAFGHLDVVAAVTVGHVAGDIGRSLREGFYMLWDTVWALVLGFCLSGAVQAFVSRDAMQRRLGSHGPAGVTRASLYGMASSSCSYAASAMARSLFARGADFVAAMVFMFASTNLVIELGIVLAVLIGWQFVAAEAVGGVIMIALVASLGALWFRGRALDRARQRAEESSGGHDHGDDAADGGEPLSERLRSPAGWADAASYTMSDLQMLRKELLIGFVVAGFLATLVPTHIWSDLFIHGHGFWTSLENVAVGPLVAIISFVCSVGNVPLAAALWHGGITFGGLVSFVFADLLTFPLLIIYRKQYGGRMALRMLGLFWVCMSAAGLATEYLFRALGWLPGSRPHVVAGDHIGLDATTVLDVVALVVLAGTWWLYRHRDRFGAGTGYAKDPVCGMQVEVRHAPASRTIEGTTTWFCSDHCAERFERDPQRFLAGVAAGGSSGPTGPPAPAGPGAPSDEVVDPICGMTVDPAHAGAHRTAGGEDVWFCCTGCAEAFDARQGDASADASGHRSR